MKMDTKDLRGFSRRVRWLRAWRGLAVTGMIAGIVASVVAILDWRGVIAVEPLVLIAMMVVPAIVGAVVGFLLKVDALALTDSIDRRASLKNRLRTAMEDDPQHPDWAQAQQADAQRAFQTVRPASVYPVRFSKWHTGWISSCLAAGVLYYAGTSNLLISREDRQERDALKQTAPAIERLAAPTLEKPDESQDIDQKKLAEDLKRFADELKRGRIPKDDALQRANELARRADELAMKKIDSSDRSLDEARTMLDKLQKAAEKQGTNSGLKPESNQMLPNSKNSQMSPEQQAQQMDEELMQLMQSLEQAMTPSGGSQAGDSKQKAMQQKMSELKDALRQLAADPKRAKELADAIQKHLSELQKQLSESGLTAEQKAQVQRQMEEMRKIAEALKGLKLSQGIKDMLKKMRETPEFKELKELMQQLAKANQSAQTGRPSLTPDQLKELRQKIEQALKNLEALSKELADDAAMKEFMQKLIEAARQAEAGGQCQGMGLCLMSLLGLSGGGIGNDVSFMDTGMLPKGDREKLIQSKQDARMVQGQRRDQGEETYIEIKGPTGLGERSSVPYGTVLPKYRKQAENALDRKQIPKEHEKRVRDYFDSLTRGGK